MKVIKDLGTRLYSGKMKRFYVVECPSCMKHIETLAYNITKKNPMKLCRSCSSKKHATKHGFANTKIYNSWCAMHSRVNSVSGKNYESYGKKGIKICTMWSDFIQFKEWAMENGFDENLELDRRDNDGQYEPSNCRWVTRSIQTQNNRPLRSTNNSGYRGVSIVKSGKYIARGTLKSKRVGLGTFESKEHAALAYDLFVLDAKLEHPLNLLLMKDLGFTKEQVVSLLQDICDYRDTDFDYVMKRTGMMNQILRAYHV